MEVSRDFGLLAVNKPKGITSTEVLNRLKERFKIPKLGHTGTLDPFAEGLLLILLGKATRLAEYYQKLPKTYRAVGLLGVETDTYDITGKVVSKREVKTPPSAEEVKKVLKSFIGEIEQIPPPFSAKKVKGKRAYKLARKGKKVELKPVKVRIYDLKLVDYKPPRFEIETTVSGGTYVRSLIKDVGDKLGFGATTERLVRTSIGRLGLEKALSLEEILKLPSLEGILFPPWEGLPFERLQVSEKEAEDLKKGRFLEKNLKEGELFQIFTFGGKFVGIGKKVGKRIKPEKVFI